MSLILSLEHAYATAIADLKKAGRFVLTTVLPALKEAKAAAPTIEAVTAVVSPQLANIERVGEAVLGLVIKAVEDGAAAADAGGVNVQLNAALIADIRAILPAVKAQAQSSGLTTAAEAAK